MEKGKNANASILIKGIGEEGLSCARITLNYDSSVVEVESVGGSEFDTFVENNVPSEGCLKMVAFQMGADPVRGDIKFAEIKLKAVGKVNKSGELSLEINELKGNEGRSVRFERDNGFFSITGEEKTEAPSAAIWVWGVLGVVLLIVVIAGVCLHIKKKRK